MFNNKIMHYKNFNMGVEIDIAGTFIYDGIKQLESMESFYYPSEVFSFLYPIAVGIERIQKVLIVLLETIDDTNVEGFEESLITHSHQQLQTRISDTCDINFLARENAFLQVLTQFYKECRYDRFNIGGSYGAEKEILVNYIRSNIDSEEELSDRYLLNSDRVKELLSRVIGAISKKYYSEVCKCCNQQNIYTYEVRSNSKAYKIFLGEFRKNSLKEQVDNERIVLKELIIFLMNTKKNNSLLKFMKGIEPLEIDPALINEYIEEICKGRVPQSLIDEVEYIYSEKGYSKDRTERIDLIGNTKVLFEIMGIYECKEMIKALLNEELKCYSFALKFLEEANCLQEDEDIVIVLKNISIRCEEFIQQVERELSNEENFLEEIKKIYAENQDLFLAYDLE